MFRELRPLRAYVATAPAIQCSHKMNRKPANPKVYFSYLEKKFAARGFDMALCGRGASIELHGAPLCTQHAGELLLSMLLAGEIVMKDGASPLPPVPPVEFADVPEPTVTRR